MISRVMQILQEQGYVDASNDKIILLGLQRTKAFIEDMIFAIVLGFFLGNVFAGVLYEISFSVNRMYTGGYHASSRKMCNIISKGNTIICLIAAFVCPINEIVLCILVGSSAVTIFWLSPIENENKKINDVERMIYRHRSILIMVSTIALYALFLWGDIYLHAKVLGFALFSVAVGLIK
ncbi:MAG TPA: hypothetical protein DEB74_00665 [Lachnospiraceae bacterium]|nr:hypothetical protein [Lachnospiraceae bacterium]